LGWNVRCSINARRGVGEGAFFLSSISGKFFEGFPWGGCIDNHEKRFRAHAAKRFEILPLGEKFPTKQFISNGDQVVTRIGYSNRITVRSGLIQSSQANRTSR